MKWIALILCGTISLQTFAQIEKLSNYVDPFIGTGGHGHTYPGASAPFGMMQLSPDTRHEGWDGCSGYHYSDDVIYGFSHTHLSGTGVPDYCDLLIVPQNGKGSWLPAYESKNGYGATFSHENESAKPGWYSVQMENGISVHLTTSKRAGIHQYIFDNTSKEKYILIDLDHRDELLSGKFNVVDKQTIEGKRISKSWATEQHFYFSILLSTPFKKYEICEIEGKNKLRVKFPKETKKIELRVGMSAVDVEGARKNRKSEVDGKSFSEIKTATSENWEKELHKIEVETENKEDKIKFYTALYHSFLNPNLFSDVDGRYRGRGNEVHQLPEGKNQYTVFSLWDTYRAAHPLFTILQQERTADFLQTFDRQFKEGGDLPVWELAGNETECMIGYHSVSVIADAYIKNVPGFDIEPFLEEIIATSNYNEFGKRHFQENGFISVAEEPESVSKTLEYAYDDFCIYQILSKAKSEGYAISDKLVQKYYSNAFNFAHIFDPQTGFMRGRRSAMWFAPFQPEEVNFNYTEANSWQYSLYAPQAVGVLKILLENNGGLETWLDKLFSTKSNLSGRHQVDITGLIGQYAHGNEPSHHMAYLYNHCNAFDKTAIYVDSILQNLYTTQPNGLSGNEDCGQMSSWYVFSSLGFYPISPGTKYYEFGRPIFNKVALQLENGNKLIINYKNNSKRNKFIQSISIDGEASNRFYLSHEELMNSNKIDIVMGSKKQEKFQASPSIDTFPESFIPTPYVDEENKVFDKQQEIHISSILPNKFDIFYSVNQPLTKENAIKYTAPIKLDTTTTIHMVAKHPETGEFGTIVSNKFIQQNNNVHLKLESEYANQYASDGDNSLIDGITGTTEYRSGNWQGYYNTDLKGKITFDHSRTIDTLQFRFLQDTRSWIFLPKNICVTIEYTKGKKEELRISNENWSKEDMQEPQTKEFAFILNKKRKVKNIQFKAENFGDCPEWHLGEGNPTWLFADEIRF